MKHIVVCSTVLGKVEVVPKNRCVRKISKKIIIIIINKKVLLFTKQIRFHQVKVTSPFLLNKTMVTLTTKQPRKARFTTKYKTAEEGLIYN